MVSNQFDPAAWPKLERRVYGERSAKYILWSVVGSMVLVPFTQELNHGSFQRFEQSRVLATGS